MHHQFITRFGIVFTANVLFVSAVRATVVSDSFTITPSRPAGSTLYGQNTEVPSSGVTWQATDSFVIQGDSTNGVLSSEATDDFQEGPDLSATVPYAMTRGGSYIVQANLFEPANGSTGNALGVGFQIDQYSPNQTTGTTLFLDVQSNGAWALLENGHSLASSIASGTISSAGWSVSAPPLVQLIVNTSSSFEFEGAGTATAIIDGQTVATGINYAVGPESDYPPLDYAAVDQYLDPDESGVIDNFEVAPVSVPESTYPVLLVGAAAPFFRRRRSAPSRQVWLRDEEM